MKIIVGWVPLAFVGTMLAGGVYLAVQQDIRQGANDPQVQMAEDDAMQLKDGVAASMVMSSQTVDPSKSLAPFVIFYDASGNVTSSQASIGGKTPQLPSGVLDTAKSNGEYRVTWQTDDGTRIAAAVSYYSGPNSGYVLAGRSLKEVEIRENTLNMQVGLIWVVTMLGSLALIGIFVWTRKWLSGREN